MIADWSAASLDEAFEQVHGSAPDQACIRAWIVTRAASYLNPTAPFNWLVALREAVRVERARLEGTMHPPGIPEVGPVDERASWPNVTMILGAAQADAGQVTAVTHPETSTFQTVAARLAAARHLVASLERQQRNELVAAIAATVGAGVVFSSADLWQHRLVSPELMSALINAGITTVRKLGKKLRQLSTQKSLPGQLFSLTRVGDEHGRALWVVE
jgi:hypothetical protein